MPFCGSRMENTVLGNALDGVPEEESEAAKQDDSKIESADNLDGWWHALPLQAICWADCCEPGVQRVLL